MARRPKDDGTAFETMCVKIFAAHGLLARRLALAGSRDEGDLELHVNGLRCIVECKTREALSAHDAYAQAKAKATDGTPVLLAWRRLKPLTEGRRRRTPVGTLVLMDLPTLFRLLGREGGGAL